MIVAVRQRAGLVQQRQDARQVGIGNRVELQARRGPLVVGERRLHLVEPGLVLGAGLQQQRAAEQQHQRYRREGAAAHEHSAPRGAGPLGDQHRLAEDHLLDEPGQEIAAAVIGPQTRDAPLVHAEGARQHPGQAIDRGPFLRARGEIEAAQHRGGVEPRTAESLLQELAERRLQACHLRGEAGDQAAPRRAALGLEPIEKAAVQPLDQELEFGPRSRSRGRLRA